MGIKDLFIQPKGGREDPEESKSAPKSGSTPVFGSSSKPHSSVLTSPRIRSSSIAQADKAFRSRVEEALGESTQPAYKKFMDRFSSLASAGLDNAQRYKVSLATTDGFSHDQVSQAVDARLHALAELETQLEHDVQAALDKQSSDAEEEAKDLDKEIERVKAEILQLTEHLEGLQSRKSAQSSTQENKKGQIRANETQMKAAFAEVRTEMEQVRNALLKS